MNPFTQRQRRLLIDTILLGIVGALSAEVFTWMLHIVQNSFLQGIAAYTPPGLPEEGGVLRQVIGPHGLWLIPVVTTLGGLISGILVYSFAPEAEGHGTDTAVKAFHHFRGYIRARVPPPENDRLGYYHWLRWCGRSRRTNGFDYSRCWLTVCYLDQTLR